MLVIHGLVALAFPFIVYALVSGSQPTSGWGVKYNRADPWLSPAGNLFLLCLSVISILKVAQHFGFLSAEKATAIDSYLLIVFLLLLVAYLAIFVRAWLRVRSEVQPQP